MKFFYLFLCIFLLYGCNKPNTVLICGDHICINNDEAKQYFRENLSIEVKVIKDQNKQISELVELNLRENESGSKKISITSKKDKNDRNLKTLTNKEISKIKTNIKKNKKKEKIAKKFKNEENSNDKKILKPVKKEVMPININREKKNIVDVCTIIKECNIEEISKYLLKLSKKKDFPDITKR